MPVDSAGTEVLFGFDAYVQGWEIASTSPERLESGSSLSFEPQNGESSPGSLRVEVPFDGSNQKIEFQVSIEPSLALTGRTIHLRVRLGSGLSTDTQNPGGIKLFAKSGNDFDYISGAWTYLQQGAGWLEVSLDVDSPVLKPGDFDSSVVRQRGLELRSFLKHQARIAPFFTWTPSHSRGLAPRSAPHDAAILHLLKCPFVWTRQVL